MKRIGILPLLAAMPSAFAIPATADLTLSNDGPAFNVLTISVDPGVFPDTDSTTLTGMVTADFDIDPSTGQTSELTLRNGRAQATDMNFQGGFGIFGYGIDIKDGAAAIFTTTPPSVVTPGTGDFDAADHEALIDQGAVTGQALGNAIDETFTPAEPVSGSGAGTGNVSLALTGEDAIYRNYDVVATLPVAFDDSVDANGVMVDVDASGTVKAVGTVQVPKSEYLAWTVDEGIPGADPQSDVNDDGAPNALAWALGLTATADASANLLFAAPAGGFQLQLPAATVAPVLVQRSTDGETWTALPSARLTPAANPIPAGSSGTISVSPGTDPVELLRLEVDAS